MSTINTPEKASSDRAPSSEKLKLTSASEQVKEETRSALGSLNFDIFSWLSKNIGGLGAKFSESISGLLDTLGSRFQHLFSGWGTQEKKSRQPSEGKDMLAETGSFLERLPVDAANIKQKLDPQSFYQKRFRRSGPGQHNSIDIAVPVGKPVYAGFDATVSHIVPVKTGTNSIVYLKDHSGNITVKYIHLSRIDVQVGQQITADTIVGLSGGAPGQPGAGTSQGPHVHMEIIHKGKHINPYAHLAGCSDCPSTLKSA